MNKNTIISIILVIIAYIISTGASYAIFFARPSDTASPTTSENIAFDESLPKTESCPLNGALYSKLQRQWWEKHRPLGVMIENHEEARPQSGLSKADVIYEAVAEGGITRFLAIFHCQDGGLVLPVRSARTYFLDWLSEYGDYPLYAHVAGANCNKETGSGCLNGAKADARGQIEDYGWKEYNDLDQFALGYPTYIRIMSPNGRDVAAEHTMSSTTQDLWKFAQKRKLTNVNEDGDKWDENFVEYKFEEDAKLDKRPISQTIHLEPWGDYMQYAIDWTYDKVNNLYKRNNGGKPHLDRDTKNQLTAKNIVVLVMVESNADDGYDNNLHLLYKNKGTGKAYIFMDGKQTLGTWEKEERTGRTLIYDADGEEIKFNRGQIWFEILPTLGVINVR